MAGLLVFVIIGIVVWTLWAPAMGWTRAFAALLERPVTKSGFLPFQRGLETAAGGFEGRAVLLALHHKRGRHSVGYLVVALQPRTTIAAPAEALSTLQASEAREALDELSGRLALDVSFEDGWLKARWQPGGFTIFPGRFDAQRWRRVLEAMSRIARCVESAAA